MIRAPEGKGLPSAWIKRPAIRNAGSITRSPATVVSVSLPTRTFRAGTTPPKELLARHGVPAGNQGFLGLRPAGIFLAMVRAEHDQRLAIVGQAHGTTPLIRVRPVGVLEFDNMPSLPGSRIRDPQILVEPGRVQ